MRRERRKMNKKKYRLKTEIGKLQKTVSTLHPEVRRLKNKVNSLLTANQDAVCVFSIEKYFSTGQPRYLTCSLQIDIEQLRENKIEALNALIEKYKFEFTTFLQKKMNENNTQ